MNTEKMIVELANILRSTSIGRCSIALAGSRAEEKDDDNSDLDLYMLVDAQKTYDEIYAIISSIADRDLPIYIQPFDSAPYGGAINFYYKGIPIEVTVKSFSKVKQRIDDCLDGRFEIIPQTWTSNGYYTFISLSELNFIKPIWESDDFIKIYKEEFRQYPEKLRKSIINCFMGRASTWINNFHYESAIKRGDVLFTTPIVLHTVLDMVQVIFALNRMYFTGDKRLETALKSIPFCPVLLKENLLFLLQTSYDGEHLQRQYDILKKIYAELLIKIESETRKE